MVLNAHAVASTAAVILALSSLALAVVVPNGPKTDAPAGANRSPAAGVDAPAPVLREPEGSAWRQKSGRFERDGERWSFVATDGAVRIVVLENRTLERVVRAAARLPAETQWFVDGRLTEFDTRNYLLLERAVIRSTSGERPRSGTADPSSAPDAVDSST
jgi:hypothetical protein